MSAAQKPLACTQEQFEAIHEALDHTRSTSTTVKVDRQALVNLMMDHSTLLGQTDRTMRGER